MNEKLRTEIEKKVDDIKKASNPYGLGSEVSRTVLLLAHFLATAIGEDESAYLFNAIKYEEKETTPNWKRLRDEVVARMEGRLHSAEWAVSPSSETNLVKSSEAFSGKLASNRIFVVHGHDDAARESVARFIEKLGLTTIILHEQANQSLTVIEKLERHSDVQFAVVLLSPDDEGRKANTQQELVGRARQNVLIELGYFVGKLGRSNVCTLRVEGTEIPSDFSGVTYTDMDKAGAWRTKLAQELVFAKFTIDLKALIA